MRFVVGRDEETVQLIASQTGWPMHPPYVALAIVEDDLQGPILGGVVFSDYNKFNVNLTLYSPGCVRRHLVRDVFRYAFDHLGCLRATASTKRSNATMRRLLPRLGFTFEGTQKQYFGPSRGDDALLFRITRDGAQKWM